MKSLYYSFSVSRVVPDGALNGSLNGCIIGPMTCVKPFRHTWIRLDSPIVVK